MFLFNCLTSHMNLITRHSGILGLDRLLSHLGSPFILVTLGTPPCTCVVLSMSQRSYTPLPRTSPSVFSLGHVVSQARRRGIRFFSSPDSPSTLVPGGLSHSPPKQTGPSSCGEREGGREEESFLLLPPLGGGRES